jgi:hypothetical protein
VISQGIDETTEATVAPNPNKTNKDGNAQQIRVLNELKREM